MPLLPQYTFGVDNIPTGSRSFIIARHTCLKIKHKMCTKFEIVVVDSYRSFRSEYIILFTHSD